MPPQQPFNPFENMNFRNDICFLTGEQLTEENKETVSVFPRWVIDRYDLYDTGMGMLGGNRMKYPDMVLPATKKVAKAIKSLDDKTEKAFKKGYEEVKVLPELLLFQWMARITFGVHYQDFTYTIGRKHSRGETFSLSPLMVKRFKGLHLMLQSLIFPIHFDGFTPWTIRCFPVNYSKDIFNYKDETHKLNFCLGMNGFGLVACLQDNGEVGKYEKPTLDKINQHWLHPIQFEELYARFIYANYILREAPDYKQTVDKKGLTLCLPENPEIIKEGKPLFAKWNVETFAMVLGGLWNPWGLDTNDIFNYPDNLVSYLIDENKQEFINPEAIDQPY